MHQSHPDLEVDESGWVDRVLGRADKARRPEPGSQRAGSKLLGSRDFR